MGEPNNLYKSQLDRIRKLYSISADRTLGIEQQLEETLKVGARMLDLDMGIISHIHNEKYTILYFYDAFESLEKGMAFELGKTYCSITLNADDVVTIDHMAESEYKTHPCYKEFQIEAYIGMPILIKNKRFGTVNFTSPHPRRTQFNEFDIDFIRLIGQWTSTSLERIFMMEEVNTAKDKAEKANKSKNEFLANMSHELRTPLHGIMSFSRFGIKKCTTPDNQKLSSYFQKIEQCGLILLNLVNDLLDLAKLESGKINFNFEKTELAPLVASVVDEFFSQLSEKNLEIQFYPASSIFVIADEVKIQQVIRNLISNAVKFSPSGASIEVTMTQKNDSVTVEVKDQGIGIPEEELKVVFDKFFQSSKTKSGSGGTGLGLAICQEIISNHGGHIWTENNSHKGAKFCFTLPIKKE